jgi:hypothetical protein
MMQTVTSRWVVLLLVGLAGCCGHARPGLAQSGGEGGSLGGSIAPPSAPPKARRVHRVRARPESHVRATASPQAAAPAMVCSLRMEQSQNPDGSSCSLVVGFSAGQRVGLFHTTAGQHIGTCEGAIPVDYVRGNQVGFAGHRRVLSDDCRASSGS